MRRLFFLILWSVQSIVACIAQQGVNFEHLSFDEALAKARAEKKMVFVDCYTKWCGPCKMMTDKVFPQEKAGDFFNSRFVCLKLDMEQGEGIELREKWQVKAYPSFFIIRPDGKILHNFVGGFDLDELIRQVNVGLNEKTSLQYLNERYEKGKMDKREMAGYIKVLSDIYEKEKATKVSKELMAKLTDKEKMQADFWEVFSSGASKVGAADFEFLQTHLAVFEKNVGKDKVNAHLYEVYSRALFPYLCGRSKLDPEFLKEVRSQIANLEMARKETLQLKGELAQATFDRDVEQIITCVGKFPLEISGMELFTIMAPLVLMRDTATKAELIRMIELGDKWIAGVKNSQTKNDLDRIFTSFRSLAHEGIYFEDLTFNAALAKARAEKKMVFVDCYTSWCSPCKYMVEKIFPQEKVGDFMNKRFISVKYDMDKGEGPDLAKKLEISAFPTFVLLKADGTIWHKTTGGGGDTDEFIERIKKGLDSTWATGVLEAKYRDGVRDKELLASYLVYQMDQHSPKTEKVAEELWALLSDEDKVSETYYFLYTTKELGTMNTVTEKYLLDHRDRFYATIGQDKIDTHLSLKYRQKLKRIFAGVDTKATVKDLEQMKKEVVEMKLSNERPLLTNIEIARTLLSGQPEQLLRICERSVIDMPAKDFFYSQLVDRVQEKLTSSQKNRWVSIGEQLLKRDDNENYKAEIRNAIQILKKH